MIVRRNKKLLLTGIASVITVALFSLCSKDQVVSPTLNDTWKITGAVQDGYNGNSLDSSIITYADRDGNLLKVVADNSGYFTCTKLPYGAVTLTIQQTKSAARYTTSVLTIASGPKESAINDTMHDANTVKFRDTSVVVKLFPFGGYVADTVKARKHDRAPVMLGKGLQAKVTYGDSSMVYASPRIFSTTIDSNGYFKLDSLPLASDAQLTILSGTVGGVVFAQKVMPLSDLVRGRGTVGLVVLDTPLTETNASTKFRKLSTSFPTKQILPNGIMSWTCNGAPDSAASYAVIQNLALSKTKSIQNVTTSVNLNIFNVIPTNNLNNNQKYFVSVFVYGANGGSFTDTATVTVASAGKEEVVSSNVLTATKDGVSGLGLSDSIFFNLIDAANEAAASVQHFQTPDTIIDLVTTTLINDGKTIIIKPKGSWLAGTKYRIKVFGSLNNGTPLSFIVDVSTEGGLNVVSSNVFDPNQKPIVGKNGFIVSDSIIITANKPLASASAILLQGSDQVPVTVRVSGANEIVKPQNVLNFNTKYLLKFSISSAAGEVRTDTVFFTTTQSGFYLVSSNTCIGGDPSKPITEFDPSAAITITMSDSVASASASLIRGTGTGISVTSAAAGAVITVTPTEGALAQDSLYSITVNASSKKGVKATVIINNFKARNSLYPIWTNVRIGNDPGKPVLNFDPLSDIIVVMSNNLISATAQINSGAVPATITVKGNDTVVIHPQSALPVGATYSVNLFVQDVNGTQYSGNIVTGLQPVMSVFIMSSNVLTQDKVSLTNVAISTVPWFKMSVAPVASSIKATVTGGLSGAIDNIVTARSDTLVVTPVSQFRFGEVVTIAFNGMAINGKAINESVSFTCQPAKNIRVTWSSVLNANLDGLTAVPIDLPIKVLLSATPKAGSITKTDVVGSVGPANITLSGDTIFVTQVTNLNYATSYSFSLQGMDVNGNAFSVSVPPSGTFKTYQNVFVVASNMIDANGYPIQTFNRYGVMWIKFSEPLVTDKNKLTWTNYATANVFVLAANALSAPADKQIVGEGVVTGGDPNASVRISNDTLFATPDNRVAIGYSQKVGFSVQIMTTTGKTATVAACVKTPPVNLFVKSTNTLDTNGVMRTDFGYLDQAWVVSSVQLDSIIAVNNPVGALPDAGGGLLMTRVRLAATGDTIFYTPSLRMAAGTTYGLTFDVHVKVQPKGTNDAGKLGISWKTITGVQITAMNLMADAATYRAFKVIGDSIVISFSKPINILPTAPTPFAVSGFSATYTTTWSADNKTATIKNTDTLDARPYSISSMDYNADLGLYSADYPAVAFNVTCADGEVKTNLLGGNNFVGTIAIKTEYALTLIGSNTVNGHTPSTAIAAGVDLPKDTFSVVGTPTLVFNRAVDTAKIKADAANQYQNYLKLVINGSAVPLQFNLAFSSDAKTITMTPVSPLLASTKYDIIIGTPNKIAAVGLKNASGYIGGGNASSILTTWDLTAMPAFINISALTPVLATGVRTSIVNPLDTRKGYSAGTGGAGIEADGAIVVLITELAWNLRHSDSITSYQFRVRSGSSSDWYILANTMAPTAYDQFNPAAQAHQGTIDLSLESFYSSLKVADGDGAGAGYTNGANVFNGGNNVDVQVRAVKVNAVGGNSYSNWSSTVSYVDNVAPGDTTYNVAVTYSETGVGGPVLRFNNTGGLINAGNLADSTQYVTLTFPEDMNTSINPGISFYSAATSVSTPPRKAGNSAWINARNYRIYVFVPTNKDYRYVSAGEQWYYSVSVANLKDYNGVTLQSTGLCGSVGIVGTGVAWPGAGTLGNNNVGGVTRCQ